MHRLKRKGAPPTADAVAFAQVLLADPCAYCTATAEVADHIHAIARGGVTEWDNLTGACRACNARKHAKPLLLFLLDARAGKG